MVRIASSAFEGMFLKALKVEGPLVTRLRDIGFDPQRMEPSYPVEVWRKSLQLAAAEYYPAQGSSQAEFSLGTRMVEGYFETIVGKMIKAAMPFLSPDSLCMRLPRFFSGGIVGEVKPPEVTKLGPCHYKVKLYGDQGVPWFTAGAIDATLRLTKVQPTVTAVDLKPDQFTCDITWTS